MSTATLAAAAPLAAVPELTPDDLAAANGTLRQGRFELVDGRLVKKPMSFDANQVAANFVIELGIYLRRTPIGVVLVEQEYQCFPRKPRQVRVPDVSFVLTPRIPVPHPTGFLRFTPDLAVEVVSANDLVYKLDDKLEDYRSAGFPLVWVINPDVRLVRVHRPGQPIAEYRPGDTLRGDGPLSGLTIQVDALVPPPPTAVP